MRELPVDRTLSKRRSARSSVVVVPHPRGRCHRGCQVLPSSASHQPVRRPRRYPTDLTDAQWAELDPLLPDPAGLAGRGGRWEKHCRRVIVDAILYLLDNGIKWRALPADFPPRPRVYKRFVLWEKVVASQRLLDRVRLKEGRVAAPSAAIVDSQSVRAAQTVGRAMRGGDGGKGRGPQTAHRRGHHGIAVGAAGHPDLDTGPGRRPRGACCDPHRSRSRRSAANALCAVHAEPVAHEPTEDNTGVLDLRPGSAGQP
ncbi:hypothetical protein CKY47_35820 [Saccharothrix yanglingensis]|uniref:Insertion element IS402-like domain-containing protein n=1 Tax=Saccharothrix yanglingensis TaxID=659496 RepID=A0ABU0XAM6_9PSEU|nr:transposase [Saccharothrix yanglingensis]MDQ2589200.1 hypothetical protein [Saccharothrix yanglingensis]